MKEATVFAILIALFTFKSKRYQ